MSNFFLRAAEVGWVSVPVAGPLPIKISRAGKLCLLWADADHHLFVNGTRVGLGFHVLSDRDRIEASGQILYFSTEELPELSVFPGGPKALYCPRCSLEILPGTPAVQCPSCRTWHHQSADRECWSYGSTCMLCPQPSAFGGDYLWSPEED